MYTDRRLVASLFLVALGLAAAACAIDPDPRASDDQDTAAASQEVVLAPPTRDPRQFIFLCPTSGVCTFDDIACNAHCGAPCVIRRTSCP
jgi:hypothetical protein